MSPGLYLERHVGQLEMDPLEAADVAAELLPVAGVLQCGLVGAFGDTE